MSPHPSGPAMAHAACAAAATAAAPARLRLDGELTIYRAAELKPVLLQAVQPGCLLELDLSDVTELDTAGVQLLLLAQRQAQALGGSLGVVQASAPVHEVLDLLARVNRELGVTIVVITHEMDVIARIAAKVAVMDRGRVVESGGRPLPELGGSRPSSILSSVDLPAPFAPTSPTMPGATVIDRSVIAATEP